MRVFPIRARLARLDCIHILEHPCPKRDVISLLDLPTSITTRPEQVQPEPHLHIEPAHPASPSCRERIQRTRRFSAFSSSVLGLQAVVLLVPLGLPRDHARHMASNWCGGTCVTPASRLQRLNTVNRF